jgi:hypothetical protein
MTPTVQGRLIVVVNGNEMIRQSTSISQQIGSILAVSAGDRIRINALNLSTGDVSSITCQFIPPVAIIPPSYNPLPTQPHLWAINTEIDFGDGTFGRRFIGTYSAPTSNTEVVVSISNAINPTNTLPEQISGRVQIANPSGDVLVNDPSIDIVGAQVIQAVAWLSASNQDFRMRVITNVVMTNAPYDIRIRYTKV